MHVELVTDPGRNWDEFAESRPDSSLGHASAWARVFHQAYGLRPYLLCARGVAGGIAGLLPLALVRTWRGGRELVSLPYLDGAGVLAADPEAAQALQTRALELGRELGVGALELRRLALPGEGVAEGPRVDLVLPLEPDAELQWKALSAKVRNQTRKAEREGLALAESPASELLPEFYAVFCENMRDLGSPVHSRSFFEAMAQAFGERLRFVVTRLGERPVGGLVAIRFGGRVTVPWASTLRAERARCPNNQIYWEAIRWAIASGAKEFDFGRSPRDSGTHRFKLGWGAAERALPWTRFAPDGRVLEGTAGPDTGGRVLEAFSRAWQRLPVPLASFLGARLRPYFSN
jgi:FemAB-related protein (PEP-CTERM system-associated)